MMRSPLKHQVKVKSQGNQHMKNRAYKNFSRKVSYFLERQKKGKGKWKSF